MTVLVEQQPSPTFEEAKRIVFRRKILAHEVGHAVAEILWARMIPRRIEVYPYRGNVRCDWERYTLEGRGAAMLKTILAGPAAAGEPIPTWPLIPVSGDERGLIAMVEHLGLDRDDYRRLVTETLNGVVEPEFRRLEVVFTALLEQRSVLESGEIRWWLEHLDLSEYITNGDD